MLLHQTQILLPFAAGVAGYLLGAIPFAVIVARRHGVDILKAGSGNPGATNVRRVCGNKAGNLVFALDTFKGIVSSSWPLLVGDSFADADSILYAQLAGFAGAVIGHCFSVFLRFKGGKGVSVSVGGLCGVLPPCLAVAGTIWLAVYFLTRYVSLGSLMAGFSLPVTAAIFWGIADVRFWLCAGVALFIAITHRSNIVRLLRGGEHRFEKKKQ
ncbi:MAG: glycerol-3-phosphate 1-O-acyltransferase PlsY [Puniceicoccales bacterium]|jgi:glycerol-3-phosphate acyltransferase PlsY|nr:glycerol-3-phosphate 1-O-acyltransferase PlsY [Puniceicoccales bacterium]